MAKNPHAVALGKLGGATKTVKKAKASRDNGRKGGAPKMRYCEMCDEWIRKAECPKCGADTVPAIKQKGGRPKKQKEQP